MSSKKPYCQKSIEVLEHIDPTKKVRVYRNLHKDCISVRQGGIVRCHSDNVVLKDCKFIVSEAGQKKVRKECKKNVHAFIEGFVQDARKSFELLDFKCEEVHYNPYVTAHWQLSQSELDEYVDEAQWVDVWVDQFGASVLAFNLTYLHTNNACHAA